MDRRRLALAAGALVLACAAAYARSFSGPFVFDDLESIPENPNIRQLWPITVPLSAPPALGALGGRPLVSLSFAVNYALGGLDVRGYHAVNLALHILSALLVWRIAARSLRSPALDGRLGGEGAALAVALLWSVHPLASEPVVYLVQRTELMMGAFYLLTLYASLRAWTDARVRLWQGVAIGACALGMACKEPMVSAPIVVVLHDLAFRARPARDLFRERGRFYSGLAAGWLVLGAILLGGAQVRGALGGLGARMTSFDYLRMQARAITHYLRLALWPSPLTVAYDWKVPSVAAVLPYGLLVVALLAAAVWAVRAGRPWLGWLGAWFFLILAPTSSILPLHTEPVAERRMYLPLAAVIALVVLAVRALLARRGGLERTIGPALVGASAIALGLTTAARVLDYRSVLAVWEDALAKAPESTTVRNNLGNAYAFAGQMDRALAQYRESIRINPDHPLAYYNIGFTLVHQNRFAEAVEPLQQAIRIRPNDADSQYILGRALANSGRPADSLVHFETALDVKPSDQEARRDYAGALMAVGRTPDAARQLAEVLKLQPQDAAAHSRLGNAYAGMGHQEAAIASYRASLGINATDARTRNNLATALVRTGRAPEAVVELKRALADDPRYALAHYNLANVLTKDGHVAEGVREYLETIRHCGEDARLRQMAFDHLRELRTHRDAAPILAAARQDPDAIVRGAATAALGS